MPAPALIALATAVAPKLIDMISNTVDKAVPDRDLAEKLKKDITDQMIPYFTTLLESQRDVIVAEAKSESWLARSWRPITMLTFVTLVVAKWLGFTAPGITPEQELALLDIIKVGLGGYVIGRSGEKIMKAYKS